MLIIWNSFCEYLQIAWFLSWRTQRIKCWLQMQKNNLNCPLTTLYGILWHQLLFYVSFMTLYDFQELFSTSRENKNYAVFSLWKFFMILVWFLGNLIWSLYYSQEFIQSLNGLVWLIGILYDDQPGYIAMLPRMTCYDRVDFMIRPTPARNCEFCARNYKTRATLKLQDSLIRRWRSRAVASYQKF